MLRLGPYFQSLAIVSGDSDNNDVLNSPLERPLNSFQLRVENFPAELSGFVPTSKYLARIFIETFQEGLDAQFPQIRYAMDIAIEIAGSQIGNKNEARNSPGSRSGQQFLTETSTGKRNSRIDAINRRCIGKIRN